MVMPNVFSPRVEWFAEQMKLKLGEPKNVAKGDWRELPDTHYLVSRLMEEKIELLWGMVNNCSYSDAIKKCADIGNFAMMIADWCKNRNDRPELG